jgi:hypothetical protein
MVLELPPPPPLLVGVLPLLAPAHACITHLLVGACTPGLHIIPHAAAAAPCSTASHRSTPPVNPPVRDAPPVLPWVALFTPGEARCGGGATKPCGPTISGSMGGHCPGTSAPGGSPYCANAGMRCPSAAIAPASGGALRPACASKPPGRAAGGTPGAPALPLLLLPLPGGPAGCCCGAWLAAPALVALLVLVRRSGPPVPALLAPPAGDGSGALLLCCSCDASPPPPRWRACWLLPATAAWVRAAEPCCSACATAAHAAAMSSCCDAFSAASCIACCADGDRWPALAATTAAAAANPGIACCTDSGRVSGAMGPASGAAELTTPRCRPLLMTGGCGCTCPSASAPAAATRGDIPALCGASRPLLPT